MRTYNELTRNPLTILQLKQIYSNALVKYNQPLMLYIDTPFCMTTCKFCNCRPYYAVCQGEQYRKYYKYLNYLLEEFKDFLVEFMPVDVYFGGGTPFFMDTPTMKQVFNSIPDFKLIKNKVMEGHPALLAECKLQLLIDNGFNYISLGVQTFNKELLISQNRLGFDFEKVKSRIRTLRENGVVVNCDLITYIDEVSTDRIKLFRQDLERMIDLEPDMVTCYYNFYNLKTMADENRNLVENDEFTFNAVRRYRSEIVRFARQNNFTLPVDMKQFLSKEDILDNMTYTPHIYLNDKREPHAYSCSGFPHFRENEIALGLGGFEHHVVYGHINREFHYEMRLTNDKLVLEQLC